MSIHEINSEHFQPQIQLLVLGDPDVGKTTIVKKLIFPDPKNISSSENAWNKYHFKYIFKDETELLFRVFDTSGHMKYRKHLEQDFVPGFFRRDRKKIFGNEQFVVFYVFSIVDRYSFVSLQHRIEEIQKNCEEEPDFKILFGNKLDIVENNPIQRSVEKEQAKKYAESIKAAYHEISALNKYELQVQIQDIFDFMKSKSPTGDGMVFNPLVKVQNPEEEPLENNCQIF